MLLETQMELCMTELNFSEKFFWPPKLGKWIENGSKAGIFEFIEKFGH